MHKVAILRFSGYYDSNDDYQKIIERVTEFAEVDNETFVLLTKAQRNGNYDFILVEQLPDQEKFIFTTVAAYVADISAEEKKKENARILAQKKRLEKNKDTKATKIAKLKKELEDLQKSENNA